MPFHLILILYGITLAVLSLVSLNRYVLISYCRKYRRERTPRPPLPRDAELPRVTIQLPIYNEYYVVERLVRSACEVDYPHDRLEIQLLDDSTDETLERARAIVRAYREQGVDVVHIHRTDRTGYKSGALANGLRQAKGEFVAIFDADFVVPRDFIGQILPHFEDPDVGIVQARWSYLNEDYSTLTRTTVMGLDAEFGIEQPGRFWGGMFLGFNGTGAMLRVSCIEDAGGWQDDTITEDLDLSYRAQLAGWRIEYLLDVTCDSEVPADIHALKAQQFRWTKGTQETAKKLLPRLWRAELSPWIKLQGSLHLLANSTYPFLLLIGILNPLVMYTAYAAHLRISWPIAAYFMFSLFGTYSYHAEAVRYLHADWPRRMLLFPLFIGQSIGLSVNNAKAALEAWLGKKTAFIRTPKYDLTGRTRRWELLRYRAGFSWTVFVELLLAVYTLGAIVVAIRVEQYGAIPFLALFGFGYLFVGLVSVRHRMRLRALRVTSRSPELEPATSRPAA